MKITPTTDPTPNRDPDTTRGVCPCCGGVVVSECRYVEQPGYYRIEWRCDGSDQTAGCGYLRPL